ncbi:hypothetical protein Y032_0671g1378 [Ancylostoma ceylanicum]|uniref:Uncharacterized protein n=1 Tax=Ancylostoma ceylanicum TaxID=53326 RepID=A0A016WHR1_9BILA|nr:hypothetical protein Y032_0671g1378 [Ancylostoma ceylanicum]
MTHNVLFLNRLFYGQLGNEFKVRRSSSLQFTHPGPVVIDDAKLSEVSALSRSSSIYSGFIRSQCSEISRMNSCRVCLGCCRIRVASCLIGMISIAISVVTICCLLSVSGNLSKDIQTVVAAPITSLVLFQIATAMLLIIGVLIDTHFLMVPFLLNSIVHICLAVGIAISVLFSSGEVKKLYGPHYEGFELFGVDENCELIDRIRSEQRSCSFSRSSFRISIHCCCRLREDSFELLAKMIVIICLVALALYVWFTAVVGMTIMLIRDKRRLGYDHQDDFDTTRGGIERISSSVI